MRIIIDTYKDKIWGRNTLKKAEMVAFVKESLKAVNIQPKQVFLNVNFVGIEEIIKYNSKYRGKNVELIGINDNGALIVRENGEYHLVHGDEISM